MADKIVDGTVPAAPAGSPKKSAAVKKAKKPRTKPNHPRTSDMVVSAIKALKERGGSSLQAIKKYIAANYKVDAEKLSPFIKKYLKSAVLSKQLVQVKGKGASGSFKLSAATAEGKKIAKKKKPTVVGAKKPAAKKRASSAKKPATKKAATKKAAAKKPVAAASAASTSGASAAVATASAAPKKTAAAKKSVKQLTKKPKAAKKPAAKKSAAKKPKSAAKKPKVAKAKKPAAKKAATKKK